MALFGLMPFLLTSASAQLHPPEVRGLYPLAGRPGMTTRVTISGVSFRNAGLLLFDKPGISATIIQPDPKSLPAPNVDSDGNPNVVADFAVAKEAPPGVYRFRILSPAGLSNIGKWIVGRNIPEMEEKEPNNDLKSAQAVTLPLAINGRIGEPGDQDVFAFDLEVGKAFVAEAQAAGVESPLDTLLLLRDAQGLQVAYNDDSGGSDSLLVYTPKKAGRYYLTLTSSILSGGGDQAYRLNIGVLPVLQAVYPAGAERGKSVSVTPIGVNLPEAPIPFTSSGEAPAMPLHLSTPTGITNSMPVLVAPLPGVTVQSPNDDMAHALTLPAPGVASGRFFRTDGKPGGDSGYFKFHVEAGRRYLIDAQCQALGTYGDPMLTLYDAKGAKMDENDDAIGRDSRIDKTFGAAGDYYVRVKETTGKTGPALVYRLVIAEPPPPGFYLSTETRGRVVGQGDVTMLEVSVDRDRWDGPVTLSFVDLPQGVTGSTFVVPAGYPKGLIFLTAAPTAPMGAFPLHIIGTAQVNGQNIAQTLNRSSDWIWKGGARQVVPAPAELLSFAVGSALEVVARTDSKELTVVRNQAIKFKVHIDRRVPYNKPVTLVVVGLPDGVTAANVVLQPNQNDGELEIKAAANARVGAFAIAADAVVNRDPNTGLDRVTAPILLTVKEK